MPIHYIYYKIKTKNAKRRNILIQEMISNLKKLKHKSLELKVVD